MSKRPRSESRDRVTLDVGGQQFTTSVATLSGASAYFSRKFSQDWESAPDEEIFLDRDADAFKVLLSCMRNRRVLLPEDDKDLCARALLLLPLALSAPASATAPSNSNCQSRRAVIDLKSSE